MFILRCILVALRLDFEAVLGLGNFQAAPHSTAFMLQEHLADEVCRASRKKKHSPSKAKVAFWLRASVLSQKLRAWVLDNDGGRRGGVPAGSSWRRDGAWGTSTWKEDDLCTSSPEPSTLNIVNGN